MLNLRLDEVSPIYTRLIHWFSVSQLLFFWSWIGGKFIVLSNKLQSRAFCCMHRKFPYSISSEAIQKLCVRKTQINGKSSPPQSHLHFCTFSSAARTNGIWHLRCVIEERLTTNSFYFLQSYSMTSEDFVWNNTRVITYERFPFLGNILVALYFIVCM